MATHPDIERVENDRKAAERREAAQTWIVAPDAVGKKVRVKTEDYALWEREQDANR